MRYWIYWNDLVQGPFEVDELISLKTFGEDLLVCMEDRQDWVPASRIADLAPAVDLWRSRLNRLPPIPPPPPSGLPGVEPLQGELFGETGDQAHLFDSDDGPSGPYAYRPIVESGDLPNTNTWLGVDPMVRVTNPFYFQPFKGQSAPATSPGITTTIAPPVREEPPEFPKPFIKPLIPEPPVYQPPTRPVEPPVPIRESPVRQPEPQIELPPARPPLKILRDVPQPPAPPSPPRPPTIESMTTPVIDLPQPKVSPSLPLVLDFPTEDLTAEEPYAEERLNWWPWFLGSLCATLLVGGLVYWWIDHYSSVSAIEEAHRLTVKPVSKQIPAVVPTLPPVPVVTPKPMAASKPGTAIRKAAKAVSKPIEKVAAIVDPRPKPVTKAKVEKIKKAVPAAVEAVLPALKPTPVEPAPSPEYTLPITPPAPAVPTPVPPAVDLWANKQNDAIRLAMAKTIGGGKTTVGNQAKAMLDDMHQKELLHAAETGERLYLPDKIAWAALREENSLYRVYLNFMAWQANGERIQTRSYQFQTDLAAKQVTTDDNATQQDFLQQTAALVHKHNPMVDDIESVLSAVDTLNKHKMRSMIIKKNRHNRAEQKNIESALASAKGKLQRSMAYFRTKYPEKTLQNIEKAYNFSEALK